MVLQHHIQNLTFLQQAITNGLCMLKISEENFMRGGSYMTQNQIAYQNMLETIKHNRVSESELGRHNVATETETNRHNVVAEGQNAQSLTELNRHNVATEKETTRSNKASLKETTRANKAREKENVRSNKVREKETRRSNKAMESNTRRGQDLTYQAKLLELQNQLDIARQGNASRERIAELQAEVDAFTAKLNATTNRSIAQLQSDTEVFKKKMDRAISSDKNRSQEDINAANNRMRDIIATADRVQKYAAQTDNNNLKREELHLQELRDQVEADFKNKKISLEEAQLFRSYLDQVTSYADSQSGKGSTSGKSKAKATPKSNLPKSPKLK